VGQGSGRSIAFRLVSVYDVPIATDQKMTQESPENGGCKGENNYEMLSMD
jgi:hypothetical protein